MKKILPLLILGWLYFVIPQSALAQTFECHIVFGAGMSDRCETINNNCAAPAYQFPVFSDGNSCGDFDAVTCPVGTHPCFNTNPNPPPPGTTGTSGTTGTTNTGGNSLVNLDSLVSQVGGNVPQLMTLGAILSAAIPFLYATAGFALFLFLISGGFKYLTSAGDPKKMESAKNTLTTALIGFTIVVVAYSLTKIVGYIFNIDIF